MKNQVKLSKKEERRTRSTLAQATYEQHKAASRQRTVTVREWDHIFKKHGVPGPADIVEVINQLIAEYRDGGITDYAAAIFDPGLTDLTKLPIGVLDQKEEGLPLDLIPETRDELRVHCERMIIRNRNPELIALVVSGWPGDGTAADKLERHVNDLWRLRSVKEEIYRKIVGGRHRAVLPYLWRNLPPKPFSRNQLRRMLICHGLLWCTNDIQLALARNALAERNPLGAFVLSKKRRFEPARLINDLRGHFMLLRVVLDLYVTTQEEAGGKPTAEVPDDSLAQLLSRRIETHANSSEINLMALRSRLDETVPWLQRFLAKEGRRFRKELAQPVTSEDLAKHFHGIWFTGLSNLQASALPILRYLQAEAELGVLIDELVPMKGKLIAPRRGLALPAFDPSHLYRTKKTRAKKVLGLYRRELLDAADFGFRQPAEKAAKATETGKRRTGRIKAGGPAIDVASEFLQKFGDRHIEDHEGDEDSLARTFYLLDIIPEARLAR